LQPPLSFIGIALIVGGIAMSANAAGKFRKAGTPVVPFERSTALVTTGLYRFTRNPMYLGLVTVLIGVAIVCGTVGPLIPIPMFVWIITQRFIVGEERFLQEIFGERYLAYKKSVRKWL
jgi:protein-S-isoprenylcysteine O-methyltransferase Ste14